MAGDIIIAGIDQFPEGIGDFLKNIMVLSQITTESGIELSDRHINGSGDILKFVGVPEQSPLLGGVQRFRRIVQLLLRFIVPGKLRLGVPFICLRLLGRGGFLPIPGLAEQSLEPAQQTALGRAHGGGLGHSAAFAAHALLHGVAQLMGQQAPAGGVAPVEGAPGKKHVLSGGEGVHAPLRRTTGGALVGVDADGGKIPAIGTAHIAHHIGAVHEFRADVGGFLLRCFVKMQLLGHIHSSCSFPDN